MDFSDQARQALDYIKSLTRRYEAEIHVLYVIEDTLGPPEERGVFDGEHVDKMLAWREMRARKRLDQICSDFLEDCPYFVRHIAVGDPVREILKLVQKEKINMVVMSTHSAQDRFHLGRVVEEVVKNAPVPVVTIPPAEEAAPAA